jgi:hypothetical protein
MRKVWPAGKVANNIDLGHGEGFSFFSFLVSMSRRKYFCFPSWYNIIYTGDVPMKMQSAANCCMGLIWNNWSDRNDWKAKMTGTT